MNVAKEFLDMLLNKIWAFSVAQYLEKIVIGNKVEPRKNMTLSFQIPLKCSLNRVHVIDEFIQLPKHGILKRERYINSNKCLCCVSVTISLKYFTRIVTSLNDILGCSHLTVNFFELDG